LCKFAKLLCNLYSPKVLCVYLQWDIKICVYKNQLVCNWLSIFDCEIRSHTGKVEDVQLAETKTMYNRQAMKEGTMDERGIG
jgi:hypothetical protein